MQHAAGAIGQEPRQAPPRRDRTVDSVRGLACLLLVFYHVIGGEDEGLALDPETTIREVNTFLGYFRMPLFTVISGFVYAMRPFAGDHRKFVLGKARRLLIPLVVVGTLYAVVQSFVPGTNGGLEGDEWKTLHFMPVGLYWYLEALFLIFLAVMLLDGRRLIRTPLRLGAVFVVAATVSFLTDPPYALGIEGAVYLFPYFLFGLGLHRFDHRFHPRRDRALAAAAVVAGAGVCLLGILGTIDLLSTRSLPALAAGGGMALLLLRTPWESGLLARIGAYSYTVYLFHTFATPAARIGLRELGVEHVAVHVVVGTVAGLALPIVLDHVVRRWRWPRLALLGRERAALPG